MSKFQFSTKDIRNPKSVTVKDTPSKDEYWVNGLKQIIKRNTKVDGYNICLYKCKVCDRESVGEQAPRCHGFYMTSSGRVGSSIVKDIKSRTTSYQCPQCRTVYSMPIDCCLKKERLTKGELVAYGF